MSLLFCIIITSAVAWRGGAMVGRRTYDYEVVSSIPGQRAAAYDSGQVVHTLMPLSPSCII